VGAQFIAPFKGSMNRAPTIDSLLRRLGINWHKVLTMTKSIPAIPLAVISLVLIGTLATGAPAAAAPRAEVPETTHDFGKVYEDKELIHTFAINNTGDAPLRIKDIDPDCDCTAADYDRQIPPGGQGKITLTIVPYSVLKKFAKHTKVFLNDPQHPEITLTMQGWGLPMIDIEPHHIVRFQGKQGVNSRPRCVSSPT
jgi:hypothetical protein